MQFLAFLLPALMACQTQGEATEIMCQAPVVCEACAGADPETGERQKLLAEYLAANITNRSVSALIEHLATASPQYRPALLDSHLQGMEIGDCPYRELLGPILTENNAPLLISPDEYPFLTGATVRATPLESRFPVPAGYQKLLWLDRGACCGPAATWRFQFPVGARLSGLLRAGLAYWFCCPPSIGWSLCDRSSIPCGPHWPKTACRQSGRVF